MLTSDTLYPENLALPSPTSGDRPWAKATEFSLGLEGCHGVVIFPGILSLKFRPGHVTGRPIAVPELRTCDDQFM
jgi:hypothetical protein